MTGHERKKTPTGITVLAVAAFVTVAYVTTRKDPESAANVPPGAVGWHGAMELYRNVALWAGKRAMVAELNYWKAVS
jgi:hypothetical protein